MVVMRLLDKVTAACQEEQRNGRTEATPGLVRQARAAVIAAADILTGEEVTSNLLTLDRRGVRLSELRAVFCSVLNLVFARLFPRPWHERCRDAIADMALLLAPAAVVVGALVLWHRRRTRLGAPRMEVAA
jgi:hypothetical protein